MSGSCSFILTGNTSDFTTEFNGVMRHPNYEYEAALLSLDTYNSIPNITEDKNNKFRYYNGQDWKIISLNTGAYELESIAKEIRRQMIVNGDDGDAIVIMPEISTSRSIVNITNPLYRVDFSVEHSIGPLLGFNGETITVAYNLSPNIVNIMSINSILVHLDIIQGSYVNGRASPTIYSFYPNAGPGYKIIETPNPKLIYYTLSRSDISRMRVWLTDQNGKLIDFRGETITIRIHIRRVKN